MLKIGMVTLFGVMIGLIYIEHTAISSDSNRIAASTWYKLYIFNRNGELIPSYNVPKIELLRIPLGQISAMSISSDGAGIVVAVNTGKIYFFGEATGLTTETTEGEEKRKIPGFDAMFALAGLITAR